MAFPTPAWRGDLDLQHPGPPIQHPIPKGPSPFCTKFSPTQELGDTSCSRAVPRDSRTQGTKNAASGAPGGVPLPLPRLWGLT